MSKTTVELEDTTKDALREARLSHESNYNETIERLLGNGETPYMTEAEVRSIANEQITERVIPEAQR